MVAKVRWKCKKCGVTNIDDPLIKVIDIDEGKETASLTCDKCGEWVDITKDTEWKIIE